jgi:predicted DsbA family dithiol-disulfide isomerase
MAANKMSDTVHIDVFFDFGCPYVYNAAVWLQKVKEDMGGKLAINWKYFSLEQVNSQNGPDWKLWEQPEDYPSRGRRAFQAAEAARRQSEAAFSRFHMALLRARHEQSRDIADVNTLIEVAKSSGLAMPRFQEDLSNRQLLSKLAEDHTLAVETLGVFGTPTLVFPGGQAVFLKIMSVPPPKECLQLFKEIRHLAEQRQYVQEVKRPARPGK